MRIPKSLSRAEEQALKPKDLFKECDNCPEMIVVPAGEFMMGSPEDEEGHTEDESPPEQGAAAHTVRGRSVRGYVRRVGRMRSRSRLQEIYAAGQRLGPRPPTRHRHLVGRRHRICEMGLAEDW